MESYQDTPLFIWPDLEGSKTQGETYDSINDRHVYPTSRVTPESQNKEEIAGVQNLYKMRQRVEAVCKVIPQHNGNVIPWIVSDLVHFSSTQERELLPKHDYVKPIFWYDITEECKSMILSKIKRAKIQRAHDLAFSDKVDIAITWYVSPDPEIKERTVMAKPEEAEVMKKAVDGKFGTVDIDRNYAKPRSKASATEEDELLTFDETTPVKLTLEGLTLEDTSRDPREENLPEPELKGGFYSCVPVDLLPALLNLQKNPWDVEITTLINPQRMSSEQEVEMQAYHEARENVKAEAIKKKKEEWELGRGERNKEEEKAWRERRENTYARALERSKELWRTMDVPVNYYMDTQGEDEQETSEDAQETSDDAKETSENAQETSEDEQETGSPSSLANEADLIDS